MVSFNFDLKRNDTKLTAELRNIDDARMVFKNTLNDKELEYNVHILKFYISWIMEVQYMRCLLFSAALHGKIGKFQLF